jgi:signal transduction histidine kinase
MSRPRTHDIPLRPRRAGVVLLASFLLTSVSFVAATAVSEYKAREIEDHALSIATSAIPSIDDLTSMRMALRDLHIAAEKYVAASSGERESLRTRIREDQAEIERDWSAYTALPLYPGERELLPPINEALEEMNGAIDALFREGQQGRRNAAERIVREQLVPAIGRLALGVQPMVELNASNAAALSEQIASIHRVSRTWAIALDVAAVVLAAVAAIAAMVLVNRYTRILEQRLSELEYFAGRLAHDIRTPLASVALALDGAGRDAHLNPDVGAMLARGSRSVQRIARLVDGLLVFALSGARPTGENQSELVPVITGAVDELLPAAREKEIALDVEVIPPVTVACSPGVLMSLVSNLVGNAIKFMGDAPIRRVSVRAIDLGPRMRIEVEDTGPGVPEEQRERIFEPYLRAASTTPGLGLGLATVRRLAEAHGGAAGLAPGKDTGSIFWFELPKA